MNKSLVLLITNLLIVCTVIELKAQQGNVAAGGDANGAGGSMSYSIGQTDYLTYSSEQGSLSLGLQQIWSYIPPILEIPDISIGQGENLCFNATETVIVAGEGKQFTVLAGGHADIIAGHNIIVRDGTRVESGGSLHARISTEWCNYQTNLLASMEEEQIPDRLSFEPEINDNFFKVYPNPTTGDFTLELLDFEEYSNIQVEIYSTQGHLVLNKELPAERLNNLSIAKSQPGIYLVRVKKDNQAGIGKIIKQ